MGKGGERTGREESDNSTVITTFPAATMTHETIICMKYVCAYPLSPSDKIRREGVNLLLNPDSPDANHPSCDGATAEAKAETFVLLNGRTWTSSGSSLEPISCNELIR